MPSPDRGDWEDVLPSRAQSLRDRAEQEAIDGIQWSEWFSPRFQRRMLTIFFSCYPSHDPAWDSAVTGAVRGYVLEHSEFSPRVAGSLEEAFSGEWHSVSPAEQLDWLAAIPIVLEQFEALYGGKMGGSDDYSYELHFFADEFAREMNDLLLDERVSFVFLNRRIRPRAHAPLHLSLVEPTEVLLSDDPRFRGAELAYLEATTALATGQYGASVTAASSTLQEVLAALGAPGETLKKQFQTAKALGLVLSHDERLFDVVQSIGGWLIADRSARGTAHGASKADREDAELAIHVAAAIALRLIRQDSDGPSTSPPHSS